MIDPNSELDALARMNTAIPWWESRAMVGSVVTILASLADVMGWTIEVGQTTELIVSLAALIGGALSWWGRVHATHPISRTAVAPGLTLRQSS